MVGFKLTKTAVVPSGFEMILLSLKAVCSGGVPQLLFIR